MSRSWGPRNLSPGPAGRAVQPEIPEAPGPGSARGGPTPHPNQRKMVWITPFGEGNP
jgi:hypothetical protein